MKARIYRNGWSASIDKAGSMYVIFVRNSRGDVHDKMRCDDYSDALAYYKSFCAIAKNA